MVQRYKLFISVLKYFTVLMAIGHFISSLFWLIGIPITGGWIWGTSLLTTSFILISSYTFKFCNYHRLFVYYSFITELFKTIVASINVPILTTFVLLLSLIGFFIVCIIALYQHLKYEHN